MPTMINVTRWIQVTETVPVDVWGREYVQSEEVANEMLDRFLEGGENRIVVEEDTVYEEAYTIADPGARQAYVMVEYRRVVDGIAY